MTQIPKYAEMEFPQGYQSFVKDIGPLLVDRYGLTMTYAAWALGFAEEKVTTSNVFCRSLLNNGDTYTDGNNETKNVKIPYLVNSGAGLVAEWLSGWQWKNRDLRHLAQQTVEGSAGQNIRLFPDEFLYWLSNQKLTLDIKAMPEGQLIFPHQPSMQMTGLWWQQMMVEGAALSLISSSTNLATVATQVRMAAQREAYKEGAPLVVASAKDGVGQSSWGMEQAVLAEQALRRTPSIGGLQSARAAFIGGWNNTSNDYAGMCYGIPVAGTFAHAWVMLHDTEEEAFENWAKVHPGSTIFLADTYDTLEGVEKAVQICKKHGLRLKGIRLDSGNLAHLSQEAYKILDAAGYSDAKIIASDSISVKSASSLYGQAREPNGDLSSHVNAFGIGSEIAVNRNQPLLDFVMKLSAQHKGDSPADRDVLMRELIKLSETEPKTTFPGMIDVVRFVGRDGQWIGDTIIPSELDIGTDVLTRPVRSEHMETGKVKVFQPGTSFVHLLQPWMQRGAMVQQAYREQDARAILLAARETCQKSMARLDPSHRLVPPHLPHNYGVGLAEELVLKRRSAFRAKTGAVPQATNVVFLIDLEEAFASQTPVEGGTLYVPQGEKVGEPAGRLIRNSENTVFVLGQDFHPANHISFMTNHPGVMEWRKQRLRDLGVAEDKLEAEALSPLTLPFDDILLQRGESGRYKAIACGVGKEWRAVTTDDNGYILGIRNEVIPNADVLAEGVVRQKLWSPHGEIGTESSLFVPEIMQELPQSLVDELKSNRTSPFLAAQDERGNQFYVIRKGMRPDIDSYGLVTENDGQPLASAKSAFRTIAGDLYDQGVVDVNTYIGGLASNICCELSDNDVHTYFLPLLEKTGINYTAHLLTDVCYGIPITVPSGAWPDLAHTEKRMLAKGKTACSINDIVRVKQTKPVRKPAAHPAPV